MKKLKYLCIDTNIFIQCCLLELEGGDDINSLEDLMKLLNGNKVLLLLPEVVDIEFYRKLDERVSSIEKSINIHKENINIDNSLTTQIKKDMIRGLQECIKERRVNKIRVEKSIQKIFSHKNTLRTNMELDGNLVADAYKRALIGRKPCKKNEKFSINNDCLIIESIKKHLFNEKKYELYFCSLNKRDFAENPDDKKGDYAISNDIKKDFCHIEYYNSLINLLKDKFNVKYEEKEIKKIKQVEKSLGIADVYWSDRFDNLSTNSSVVTSSYNDYPITVSASSVSSDINNGNLFYNHSWPVEVGLVESVLTKKNIKTKKSVKTKKSIKIKK